VETQGQRVDVAEGAARNRPDGVIDDLRRNRIAQLIERLHQNARHAVGDDEGDRDRQRLFHPALRVEHVDDFAVEKREREREDLGGDERHHRPNDALLQVPTAFRPQIRR